MNNPTKFCVFTLVLIQIFLVTIANSETPSKKRQVLRIVDHEWPLIFEDGEFSDDLLDQTTADINLVYGHYDSHMLLTSSHNKKFKIDGQITTSQGFLQLGAAAGRYFPKSHTGQIGYLVTLGQESYVAISKELLTSYKEAVAFKKAHTSAFDELVKFLNFLNSASSLKEMTDREKVEMFVFVSRTGDVGVPRGISSKVLDRNIGGIKQLRYRAPSILDCLMAKDLEPKVRKNLIYCETLTFRKDNGKVSKISFGYYESRWRFILPDFGT